MPTLLQLLSAVPATENTFRLAFNVAPKFTGILDPNDGFDLAHYTVTPVAGGVGVDGQAAYPLTPILTAPGPLATQIDLTVDRMMANFPCQYLVAVAGLVNASDGSALDPAHLGVTSFGTRQFFVPSVDDRIVKRIDIANPQSVDGLQGIGSNNPALLGTLFVDVSGDYATDEGLVSLKKRIYRVLTTRKGAFAHAPEWGVGVIENIKRLMSASVRARIVADAQIQITSDPDVSKAVVYFDTNSKLPPGSMLLVVLVKTMLGQTAKFQYRVTIGGT